MILGDQDAEEAQFGAAVKKQRWQASQLLIDGDIDAQAQELLAWELEQENWTEKSDAAILDDPQWQRVGITRVRSTSPFSDDERHFCVSGRQSPIIQGTNQTFAEPSRPPMTPSLQDVFFLEDQRLVEQPTLPVMSMLHQRTVQHPMSPGLSVRSSHQFEAALSPTNTPTPLSPSPTVQNSSPMTSRYNAQYYLYSPHSHHASGQALTLHSAHSSHYKVFGKETLGMRMRSFSPPAIIVDSPSTSSQYPYSGSNHGHFNNPAPEIHARIASAYNPEVPRAASWNTQASLHTEADQLEAEFAWLESSRGLSPSFVGVPVLEQRDEQNARTTTHVENMGYALDPLEKQYERMKISNQENEPLQGVPSDEVIHLEDQASMGDDSVEETETAKAAVGFEELKAEFDEAVRRKQALLRVSSMDSHKGENLVGETSEAAAKEGSHTEKSVPTRRSTWQEKLERFERRGLANAEANLDVSKYPRLQQIRQRRKERLKALMTIRQERAEIWNTLEANWEQMENSMARRLAADPTRRNRGQDPEPTSPRERPPTGQDEGIDFMKDGDTLTDSLPLSASEGCAKATEVNDKKEFRQESPDKVGIEVPASELNRDNVTGMQNEAPAVSVADLVDYLVEDFMTRNSLEGKDSPAVDTVAGCAAVDRVIGSKSVLASAQRSFSPKTVTPTVERGIIPIGDAMVSPFDSITDTDKIEKVNGKEPEELLVLESAEVTERKKDPPTSIKDYISQNMSDVGTKVVELLNSVRSKDEQQPVVASQGTDTNEEEASQVAEETRDDDDTSNGLAGFEDDDPDLEQQGCVNPLQNIIGRRNVAVDDIADHGCMNPFASLGLRIASKFSCLPSKGSGRARHTKSQVSGFVDQLRSAGSDIRNDAPRKGCVEQNESEDNQNPAIARDGRTAVPTRTNTNLTSRALSKKSKRSKKMKHKKEDGGIDTFFALVDDLLISQILNIIDEKVVDNMAHRFGFD